MNFHVTAVIQQEDDWYVAKCLENDVASQGKTLDEDSDDVSVIKKTFVPIMEIAI